MDYNRGTISKIIPYFIKASHFTEVDFSIL
jgi:hypothetical protein